MYRLSRRFRRRFGKDREERKDKHALDYVIVLLDESDLSFNLHVSFSSTFIVIMNCGIEQLIVSFESF